MNNKLKTFINTREIQCSFIWFAAGIMILLNPTYIISLVARVAFVTNKQFFNYLMHGDDFQVGLIGISPLIFCLGASLYFWTFKKRKEMAPWRYWIYLIFLVLVVSVIIMITVGVYTY